MKDIPHKAKTNGGEKKITKKAGFLICTRKNGLQLCEVSNYLSSYSYQLKTSQRTLWKNETVKGNGLLDHK